MLDRWLCGCLGGGSELSGLSFFVAIVSSSSLDNTEEISFQFGDLWKSLTCN